jgi:peptide/nickel transport system permease protein
MWGYIVRRLLATIPVVAVVAIVVFSILHLAPGDPAAVIAGDQATPEQIERIRANLGLDRPFHVQFLVWIGNELSRDLGT